MSTLGVWSIDGQDGEEDSQQMEPRKVDRSEIELEILSGEGWIVKDVQPCSPKD